MAVGVGAIAGGVAVIVGVDLIAGVGVFVGLGVAPGSSVAVGVELVGGSCSEADGVCTGTSASVSDESAVAESPGSCWTDGVVDSGFEGIGVSIAA